MTFVLCLQGGQCWEPATIVRVCAGGPDTRRQWGGCVEVPGAAGGRPQCAAEPGRGSGGCAGLCPLLQSHRVLGTAGTSGAAVSLSPVTSLSPEGPDSKCGDDFVYLLGILALPWQAEKLTGLPSLLLPSCHY